jgi:hypothetical protein
MLAIIRIDVLDQRLHGEFFGRVTEHPFDRWTGIDYSLVGEH